MPQLFKSQEKRFTNKNLDKKKFILSNNNYFQRNINNNNLKKTKTLKTN